MFTKTMKFDDLSGNEVEQKFYFNYNRKEIGELLVFGYLEQFPPPAGETREPLEDLMARLSTDTETSGLTEEQNVRMAYKAFHDMLLDAYGVKGEDNVTFEKTERTRAYFRSHVAFVELIFEMMNDMSLAAEFFEQCLPPKQVAEAKAEMAKQGVAQGNLFDMSEEANRRQQDPATRIEPGVMPENADPNVVALAQQTAAAQTGQAGPTPVAPEPEPAKPKPKGEWGTAEIMALSDEEFAKLDAKGLNKEALAAAWQRKTS